MWSAILAILSQLLGLFTRKDERDIAEQTGEKVGHGDDAEKSLGEVQLAESARTSVADSIVRRPSSLRDDDGFERPN